MTQYEENNLNMLRLVKQLLDDNYTQMDFYTPYVEVYNEFNQMFDAIISETENQQSANKGYRLLKIKLKDDLIEASIDLCYMAHRWAMANDDTSMVMVTDMRPYKYIKMREREFAGAILELHDALAAKQTELEPMGITVEKLASFKAAGVEYTGQIGRPKEAIEIGKNATERLKSLFIDARTLLREKMDRAINYYRLTHRDVFDLYRLFRRVKAVSTEVPAIKGVVKDAEGRPLKGLIVRIAGVVRRKSTTTAMGKFKFIRLGEGKFTLHIYEGKKQIAVAKVTAGVPAEVVVGAEE
ncbi:MAG: carboxypeptidase-like regulatory domain-containing protein [Bacteroidetes bacterium]|nr:carboxypeptidase-like regulatory domain-containing protein [Bacteroidota bacterium]